MSVAGQNHPAADHPTLDVSDPARSVGGRLGLPLKPVALALLARPDLWATAARAGLSMAPTGWWRRPPFLPVPDPGWLRFRLSTAYGGDGRIGPDSPFEAADLITWLEWRRSWPG